MCNEIFFDTHYCKLFSFLINIIHIHDKMNEIPILDNDISVDRSYNTMVSMAASFFPLTLKTTDGLLFRIPTA